MFFLIRVAFWLSIVVVLLPTGSSEPENPETRIGAGDAFAAAGAALADLRQFCTRQSEACAVGAKAAAAFGQKAQTSAKMAYEFFTEKAGREETNAPARPLAAKERSGAAPQGTLTAADRAPAWRNPPPRPEHHASNAS